MPRNLQGFWTLKIVSTEHMQNETYNLAKSKHVFRVKRHDPDTKSTQEISSCNSIEEQKLSKGKVTRFACF